MAETDLAQQLEKLFRETGGTRHKAYIETDGADPVGQEGEPA